MEDDMPNVNIRISVQRLPSLQRPIATVLMITCANKYLRAIRHVLTKRSPHLFGMYTCIISKKWSDFSLKMITRNSLSITINLSKPQTLLKFVM